MILIADDMNKSWGRARVICDSMFCLLITFVKKIFVLFIKYFIFSFVFLCEAFLYFMQVFNVLEML